MAQKRVWLFREGNADMRALLGGKGANLAEMTNLGLPVPPGLTITTEVCMEYINSGNKMPAGLMDEVKAALKDVEVKAGKTLKCTIAAGFGLPFIDALLLHTGFLVFAGILLIFISIFLFIHKIRKKSNIKNI